VTSQWMERQLLPPRDGVSIADVVAKAGWIPSAGGTGPYLAIRARVPSATRQDVDDAGLAPALTRGFKILKVIGSHVI
jgi:hypothetical protein